MKKLKPAEFVQKQGINVAAFIFSIRNYANPGTSGA